MLFIIVCLLFSSSRSLLNVSYIFSILFLRFWVIFTIITLNYFSGTFPISSSLIRSCRFLPCSFVCNKFFCHFIFFFYGWGCIPVLLVVWPETSSTGVCRQLHSVRSLCWDEDLQEVSLQLIFPGVWGSLLIQRFGLRAPTTGAQAWPLAWEPRSRKLRGKVKKILKKRKKERKKKRKKQSSTISKNKIQNKIRKIKNVLGKIKL